MSRQVAPPRYLYHSFARLDSALDFASQQPGDYVRVYYHGDIIYVTVDPDPGYRIQKVIYEGHPDNALNFDITKAKF